MANKKVGNDNLQEDGFTANGSSQESSLRIVVLTSACARFVKLQTKKLFGGAKIFFKALKSDGKDHEYRAKGVFNKRQHPPKPGE